MKINVFNGNTPNQKKLMFLIKFLHQDEVVFQVYPNWFLLLNCNRNTFFVTSWQYVTAATCLFVCTVLPHSHSPTHPQNSIITLLTYPTGSQPGRGATQSGKSVWTVRCEVRRPPWIQLSLRGEVRRQLLHVELQLLSLLRCS